MILEKIRFVVFIFRLKFLKKKYDTRTWIQKHGCPKCGFKKTEHHSIHSECSRILTKEPKKIKKRMKKNIKKGLNPITHCPICKKKLYGKKGGYVFSCLGCGYNVSYFY